MLVLVIVNPNPLLPMVIAIDIPCRDSSNGVMSSFLSLKKSYKPWSGSPVTFDVGCTGVGSFWFLKSFSLTESVCLARIPVCRTPETPRFLLLSPRPGPFSNAGEVEKRARGVRRVHCANDA